MSRKRTFGDISGKRFLHRNSSAFVEIQFLSWKRYFLQGNSIFFKEIFPPSRKSFPLQGNLFPFKEIFSPLRKFFPLQGNSFPFKEIFSPSGKLFPLQGNLISTSFLCQFIRKYRRKIEKKGCACKKESACSRIIKLSPEY